MSRALKWRIAIGFLLVFLAGAATGVFAGAWHARNAFAGRHGGMIGERMREHLKRQLNLTPDQLREVDPILDRTAAQLQTIRSETGARVSQTMEQSHQELAKHLTSDQQAQLQKLKKRHLRMMMKGHGRRRPPPPSP